MSTSVSSPREVPDDPMDLAEPVVAPVLARFWTSPVRTARAARHVMRELDPWLALMKSRAVGNGRAQILSRAREWLGAEAVAVLADTRPLPASPPAGWMAPDRIPARGQVTPGAGPEDVPVDDNGTPTFCPNCGGPMQGGLPRQVIAGGPWPLPLPPGSEPC